MGDAAPGNLQVLTKRREIRVSLTVGECCEENIPPRRISKIQVDACRFPATVIVPREAGLLHFGVRSTYIWDCKLELNFVPVYDVVIPYLRERRRTEDRKQY